MAEVSDDDLERLAARLAMLVSEEGEAEAAGRAVSHLTRRLGMTGGQLKEMFLAGASGRPAAPSAPPHARATDIERLEREIATLRRGARETEYELRNAERERDVFRSDVERLRGALFRAQSMARAERILGGIVLVAVLVAAAVAYIVPFGRTPAPAPPAPAPEASMQLPSPHMPGDQQPDVRRIATVRSAHALVYAEPDHAARVIASLTPGSSLVVHRLFWNMLYQWAEVEVASGIGFVVTTDITIADSQ